ncbi:Tegument antigen [Schistosoma japonicum]|uniref:Tegument antigen n=1 Tax=Schistosoma japonicum TaxID=6182 RepID=A0A4Z2CU00_SCHJA|nr:Tegument antigen [Schistosoma japonicum]
MVIKIDKQDDSRSSLTKRLLEVFHEIDKDHNELITNNQLKRYIETNKLDVDLIQKWTKLFQIKNTNQLSLEDICEHFQLNIKDVRQQRDTQLKLEKLHHQLMLTINKFLVMTFK